MHYKVGKHFSHFPPCLQAKADGNCLKKVRSSGVGGWRSKSTINDQQPAINLAAVRHSSTGSHWEQKMYEIGPLTCPECQVEMKIIRLIDQTEEVKHILQHLGLWKMQKRPPSKINPPQKPQPTA